MGGLEGPPKPPECSERPGVAVALLCLPKSLTPGKDCRSQESFFLSCQRPGAGRYSHTDDSRPCPHAASPWLVVGDDDAHMGRRARMMSIRLGDRVTLVTSSAASNAETREQD